MPHPQPDRNGFSCPFCGQPAPVQSVSDRRHRKGRWDGFVRRTRRCRNAHYIRTLEMLDPAQLHELATLTTVGNMESNK